MEEEVSRASNHVFQANRLSSTETRAGVLIYLSLFEKRVQILCDVATAEALGQKHLDEIRDAALERLKEKNICLALQDAINVARGVLKQHFPASPRQSKVPSDEVLLLHPRP